MLLEKIQLEEDETMIKMVRKHWFILVAELLGITLMAFMPLLVLAAVTVMPENEFLPNSLSGYYPIFMFLSAIWVTFCIMIAAMIWTHYYLDLWIITDRRIIVIEQLSFFHRKVSSFRLERLQDIKVRVEGIIATFLNFGTIRAQTASAAESNFTTHGLPDPRELQSLIQRAMDARLKNLHARIDSEVNA